MTNDTGLNSIQQLLRQAVYPATWLLRRLKFLPKFVVIGVLLLIPLIFVAWLQYRGTSDDIEFNRLERMGMRYIEPLHDYINAQQRHWVAAVARASGASSMAQIEEASAAEVARLEKLIDDVDTNVGATLKTTARWQETKAAWAKALSSSGVAAIDRAHADAVGITADLTINYVANFSKLILDPDLDSYWLMDIATVKGPALGTQIAQQTTKALQPSGNREQYIYEIASPQSSGLSLLSDTENVNLKTAMDQTKNFGNNAGIIKNLPGPLAELKASMNALAAEIRSKYVTTAAGTESPAVTPNATGVAQTAIGALERLDKFYDATNPELETLIERRIADYEGTRRTGLLLTLFGIALLLYIFAGFYFGMTDLVTSLNGASTRMIRGTDEKFATENRDETANIVTNFNEINQSLVEARVLRDRVQGENAETQRSIVELLRVVSDASDGDLTIRAVTGTGSLGNVADAFNMLMESLEGLVGDVSKQVKSSEQAVQSISEVAKRLAAGANNQSREVSAARGLVDNVAKQIAEVSNNAQSASTASKRTAATAQDGEKAVANVIHGMESLRANVQSGAKKMKNLGDRSMEITSIVETISRISEQTNMLALNAAIEAARAGEHGRGFRVVADEVRKLAERANIATKDIEKLVKAITAETNETIKAIEQQTQVVEDESKTVGVAGDSLRKIRVASEESVGLVAQITTVAQAQVEQAQRVAKSMESVSASAADAAQGAETTVTTVADLVKLSTQLRKAIGKFRVSGVN